ncbi:ABC transporter substrate-binding protein [Micromonospora sp. WMMA1363]|uniref:ABC transporter substrate-binding protein n=1 Tax=Micromonospora sp. WMMA1363 TaxID=3053985 RepID=UPI00259C86F3|nr:ABC transporter substrate-binding protein [Micromonospora sp. WMMA1363]MDM4718702.1 ABC transporter substrate-binding protein [Micromonospora sp. WMMA1363]
MRRAAVAAVGALALLSPAACGGADSGADQKDVEVFTWWADGGEKAGLDGLVATFGTQCGDYSFVNGAVAGGAGSNAKQVLASRLQQGDAPDTFQAHAGAELSDYIAAGQVEDLSGLYKEWGLSEALPPGLIDNLTVDGKIYSVPANIHRANVLWTNKTLLSEAGVPAEPTTMADFFTALDALKAKGVGTPLAVGKDWTQLMLLEAVLISDLGAEQFTGLWNGDTDWNSPEVTKGIEDYKRLLTYTNADRDTFDWTDAGKLLKDGKAGFFLMGDWAPADFDAKGFTDYGYVAFPGNGDTFQWLADSFVLPKDAKNAEGTKCWLKTVGSAEGQQAFNIKKGSIPARTDVTESDYPVYQQSAIKAWKTAKQVPSCAHGAACSQGFGEAANSAIGKFSSDQDVAGLQKAMAAAAAQFGKN